MAARNKLHTAAFQRGGRQRDPCRDHLRCRAHAPIGQVLMHRDKMIRSGVLDKELRAVNQDIGADDPFDHVEDRRTRGQLIGKGHHALRVHPHIGDKRRGQVRSAPVLLHGLKLRAVSGGLDRGQHRNGKEEPVLPIAVFLRRRKRSVGKGDGRGHKWFRSCGVGWNGIP